MLFRRVSFWFHGSTVGASQWSAGLPPPYGDQQEDLPHWEEPQGIEKVKQSPKPGSNGYK